MRKELEELRDAWRAAPRSARIGIIGIALAGVGAPTAEPVRLHWREWLLASGSASSTWVTLPLAEQASGLGLSWSPAAINSLVMWAGLSLWCGRTAALRSNSGSLRSHASVLIVIGAIQFLVWQYMPNEDSVRTGHWIGVGLPVVLTFLVAALVLAVGSRLILLAPVMVALMAALILGTIGGALGR